MTDQTIEREIVIDAPAEVVWRTITEPEQITQWFADRVRLDVRPGGAGTFVFHDDATAAEITVPLVVEAVDPPRLFSFRWNGSDPTPAPGSSVLVTFTLVAEGDERTRLRVTEVDHDSLGWPAAKVDRYVEENRGGWDHHLGRLGRLLGTPA